MKIDLRKDKGILTPTVFTTQSVDAAPSDQSEDERIAEIMRRRQGTPSKTDDTEAAVPDKPAEKKTAKSKSNRNPIRELILLILMLVVTAYYLQDKGLLQPYQEKILAYWTDSDSSPRNDPYGNIKEILITDGNVLPDHIFNELMPVTDDIAAMADSLYTYVDSLEEDSSSEDSSDIVVYEEFTPIDPEPVQLSDADLLIIDNRSLLLMLIDVIGIFPQDMTGGSLFMKRDAITFTAPRGGAWVNAFQGVLDKFVSGSFVENYDGGNAKVSRKFEIIMNTESDFQAQNLDELRLLDVLAHPFNDYLQQIIIDLSRKTDDNPAKFSFSGTPREIQYILSSWAECRCNIKLISAEFDFNPKEIFVTLDVEFFDYRP